MADCEFSFDSSSGLPGTTYTLNLLRGEKTPPRGIEFPSETHALIYQQFAAAREISSWREFDLIILNKMAGLEVLIREGWDAIAKSSMVIENKRGTPIENPMLRVIDTLTRQQLAMVRSISLGVTASKPSDLNAGGKTVGDMKSEDDLKTAELLTLIG